MLLRLRAGDLRAVDLRAVDLRAAGLAAVERPVPPVEDFARDAVDFFAVERFAVPRFAVERAAVERLAVDLRPPVRADPEDVEPLFVLVLVSIDHLPVITRCAASATASAISEPSLVALAIMLLAVSAASRPASRIARRALGLALIAAAAAASPAASISLLIAPLASLSTVLSLELEEVFREDFAMNCLPPFAAKDTSRL